MPLGNPDVNGNFGVVVQPTEVHIGQVGGASAVVSANFTRPNNTTAYASGQLVANATAAGSVTPITLAVGRSADISAIIRRLRLKKSGASLANAQFRVHLYRTLPTVSNGDGAAWLTNESNYIGSVDITIDKAFTDGAKGFGAPSIGSDFVVIPDTGTANIYALIEARAAYTPVANEVFTLSAEVLRD